MTTNVKLKEAFEVDSKYGAFFTGGNIEWVSENVLLCQKETSLQFLDIETGTVSHSIGEENEVEADVINTFTSNSDSVVTSHKSGLLKLWQHDGAIVKQWKSIHKGPIAKLCLASDERLVSGGSDGVVRVWDLKHNACTQSLRGCQGVVSIIGFHQGKNSLFAAGNDGKIHCWDLSKGSHVREYSGHFSRVTSISFHHDQEQMVSSGRDKVVILWNISTGTAVRTLPVFEAVESVVVLPEKFKVPGQKCRDGIFVATAGERGVIRVWEVNGLKEVYAQENSLVAPCKEEGGLAVTKLLFHPEKEVFGVVSVEHNIILHDLKTFKCLKQFVGFSDEILDVCFVGESDKFLAVATNSADIKLYDYSTMSCRLLQGHTDIVLALSKSAADLNLLLSSGKDNTVRLWRVGEDQEVSCLGVGARHTGSVGSVALSQTSASFAVSVSQDTCIKLWEIPKFGSETQTLECLRTEVAHQKDINCITVSPNDKIFATGSQDKTCKLWTDKLELVGVLRGHKRGVWSAKFSPIDQVIITSSADCTVRLWSITELNCLKTFEGHESSVLKVDFLSHGLQILTAGADGFLKVFNVKTSECTTTLDQHEGRVWALTVRSDEAIIVSGGADSQLVKWKDVTLERRLHTVKEVEELALQEQQLSNLVQNNELLKALKLALRLNRPLKTLKIIEGITKKGDTGLADTITELTTDQKDSLLQCATTWNTNSKNCQAAQLVLNILLNEIQSGRFRPMALSSTIESTLPYTERHFKRLTQLLQDLYFINYTINCMQPHAKQTD